MDGSTDAGNREQELIFISFCHRDVNALEIRSHTRYLALVNPATGNSAGLISCLKDAFARDTTKPGLWTMDWTMDWAFLYELSCSTTLFCYLA